MDSLQTLSLKSLLDLYAWDLNSLNSIKTKIDEMMQQLWINEWRSYLLEQDTQNQYTKQINGSQIVSVDLGVKITISYHNVIYEILKDEDEGDEQIYWFKILIGGKTLTYSGRSIRFGSFYEIIEDINDRKVKISDESIFYGLFLWRQFCYKYLYTVITDDVFKTYLLSLNDKPYRNEVMLSTISRYANHHSIYFVQYSDTIYDITLGTIFITFNNTIWVYHCGKPKKLDSLKCIYSLSNDNITLPSELVLYGFFLYKAYRKIASKLKYI